MEQEKVELAVEEKSELSLFEDQVVALRRTARCQERTAEGVHRIAAALEALLALLTAREEEDPL